jgi:hypothetical protein
MRVPRIVARVGRDADDLDEVMVDAFAAEFREAFTADILEEERAVRVYEIHIRLRGRQDVYLAVGRALGSRFKNAIRKYIDDYRKPEKAPSLIEETERDEANLFSDR